MADVKTIPEWWTEVCLGDFIDVKHGFAFKGDFITDIQNNNILLTPGNFVIGGGWKDWKKYFSWNDFPSDYILNRWDIVLTMTDLSKDGDTLWYPALVPNNPKNKYLHNQRIGLVKIKNTGIDGKYLYWKLRTKEYQKSIVNSATWSTVRHTSPWRIREYNFFLPPFPEQQGIAKMLSSFDNKIEFLREQNETLEKTAQTIFQEWFGKYGTDDELPEGWRVGKLGEEFDILMWQSPNGESYNEVGKWMVFFQGRTDFTERFPTVRLYTTEPKRVANKFDILVSVRAPVGDINVAIETCCIWRGLATVKSEYKSYCLYKIQSLKESFDKFESEWTVFGSINKDALLNIEVTIPPKEWVLKFEDITKPMDAKIFNNYQEIQSLSRTRDELLPRLMNGEVKVEV